MPSGNHYKSVDRGLQLALKDIVGEEDLICSNPNLLGRFAHDQVADRRYGHVPEAVVFPQTAEQISQVLILANEHMVPITPRGAGSGLSGGAVPLHGGICMSLERMNRIIEIDKKNLTATLEPGVITRQLDQELAKFGLFFAGYPLSEEFCTIGGNVAENAGGGRAVKYGVTSRYVTGLEVVLPTGVATTLGGKSYKDVTGYDLIHLLVGSEGTLGVFTKIILRLLPRPTHRTVLKALFAGDNDALAAVPEILSNQHVLPSAVEFIDATCLKVSDNTSDENPLLLIEIDGEDPRHVSDRANNARGICESQSAIELSLSADKDQMEALWKIRKQIPWVLKRMNPHLTAEDIVVPVGTLPDLLSGVRKLEEKWSIAIPCFGHAADGNLHASPMRGARMSDGEWDETLRSVLGELYRLTYKLGGTISGEHGIGHKRKPYLPLVLSETHLNLLKQIKRGFDPNNILNPGKIFDLS